MDRSVTKALSVYASAVVTSMLSNLFRPSAVVVVVLAVVVFVLLVLVESSSAENAVLSRVRGNVDLVRLAVLSLLAGVLLGAFSVLSGAFSKQIAPPWHAPLRNAWDWPVYLYGYEVLAFGILGLVAVVAVFRRSPAMVWGTFITMSFLGVTLAIQLVDPGSNNATLTFIGWTIPFLVGLGLLRYLWSEESVHALRALFGSGRQDRAAEAQARQDEPAPDK